jgi:uncharacterized protein (TIGR02453 family)
VAFEGFPKDTVAFLTELTANNSKEWFDENRKRYDAVYAQPAKDFVDALAPRLEAISPTVHAEAAVNKSIFRVNRDTRFSADKTPYKNHIDMMFWDGTGRSRECAAFFFRLTPEGVHLGAGKHGFDKNELVLWRKAVQSDAGEELVGILDDMRAAGFEVGGEHYKSVPRGLPKDHPRAELLCYNGLHAFSAGPHPASLNSAAIVDHCIDRFAAVAPLLFWVRDNVVEPAKA